MPRYKRHKSSYTTDSAAGRWPARAAWVAVADPTGRQLRNPTAGGGAPRRGVSGQTRPMTGSRPALVKLVVFVPDAAAEAVRRALGEADAGHLGGYSWCSYSVRGRGRFLPGAGTDPHIGTPGQLETVDEQRVEVTCRRDRARAVAALVREAHPYEEVVIDLYPLLDEDDL